MIHYVTDKDTLNKAIQFLKELPYISLDTETTGVDPLVDKILLISAGNKYQQYVLDVARLEHELHDFKQLLETKHVILHNAKFDYKFLKQHLHIELEYIYDTMLSEQLLLKGRRMQGFGLDDVVDKYCNIKLNKEIRTSFVGMKYGDTCSAAQIQYSGEDVVYLEDVKQKQLALIAKYNLAVVLQIEMEAVAPTGDMELNGIYLSPLKWHEAEEIAKLGCATAKKDLDTFFAPVTGVNIFSEAAINYGSPKQLLPALKTILGSKGTALASTSEDALKDISHPAIDALLKYREHTKRLSTYGSEFLTHIHPVTGRVHTTFHQLFTDTGRYSSSNPNLQNIPREKQYRDAFIAWNPDYRIIGCDYSGMELRILADITQEPFWINIFRTGKDLHCEIGSRVYGKPIRKKGTLGPDDPGENYELRQPVKSLNFGIGYGMGPKKLARQTGISYDAARLLIRNYWIQFPRIKAYFDKHVEKSLDAKCVLAPYDGRLRWLDGFDYDSPKDHARMRNMSMNFPMQSGNASITKKALAQIRHHIKGKDAKLILTIHDEILIECHKDIADEIYSIIKKDMIEAAQHFMKNVPVEVEGHVSDKWEK